MESESGTSTDEVPTTLTSVSGTVTDKKVQEAIEVCKKQIVTNPETFIDGWKIISINQWNKEQERLLLVTTGAYYRVKFDFFNNKIIHFHRIAFSEITAIHKGFFQVDKFTPLVGKSFSIRGEQLPVDQATYGVRIFDTQNSPKTYNPFSKNQCYRTFCTEFKGAQAKGIINTIVTTISEARKKAFSPENIVVDADVWVPNHLPIVSAPHNKLQLGKWTKSVENDH